MTTLHKAAQMALDALDAITDDVDGTGLNTMPSFDKAIDAITALREALSAPEPEPVAWCELTPNGSIIYFDGKPMIMVGPVGNECHTVPLFTSPPAAPIDGFGGNLDEAFERAGMVMVPREPTEAMCISGDKARHSVVTQARTSAIYRAMIAAAPAPAVPLTDDMVEKEFVSRGDGRGQGLHPYWKSAFREGWHFARAMIAASPPAPAVAEPLSDERIDEIFEGAHENMPKGVLFRTFIARAIEQAHGIGGGGK